MTAFNVEDIDFDSNGINLFVLDHNFMSNYYTVFDRDHDKVGFAEAI
jgi:hypothetical protein